jgi:23S rRNA pseudouridine1911/1915/1917 synthase
MIHAVKKDEWLQIQVPADWVGMTIEEIVRSYFPIPKKLLHELRMEKGILLNGEHIPWNSSVSRDDCIYIKCCKEEESDVIPEDLSIHILYEDDHLLIVNKPIMMDTHPNEKKQVGTLSNGVAFHWQENGIQAKVRHVHRLDRDTSGAILFAKYPLVSSLLDQKLERREIKRNYIALVHGIVSRSNGTISEPIGRDRHHPTRRRVSNGGQSAITHFEVLEKYPKTNVTKLSLVLDTGRTHQIRVHMSHIGHPIIGDELYGGKTNELKHQALHAANIAFLHPITNETINIEAPLPAYLQKFEQMLR